MSTPPVNPNYVDHIKNAAFISSFITYGFNVIVSCGSLIYLYVGSRYKKTFLQPMFIRIIVLLAIGSFGFLI